MQVSVILPTYNEKGNIIPLIREIKKNLINYSYEVIVIDDDSPDGTANSCREFFKKEKRVKIFVRRGERGLARAIFYGIKKAKGNNIIVMDTDFNHDPKKISSMLSTVGRDNMVIGSRYIKGGGMQNRNRYWLSKFYNIYLRIVLGIPVADFLSGFFCVNRAYINKIIDKEIFFGYGDYFIRLIFYVYKTGGRFKEIPVFYSERASGKSKSNLYKMFLMYTKTSLDLISDKNSI